MGELFSEVQPEDLVKYGLIPEFIGRLPVIATLADLDIPALIQILTEPKNALVKQYQKLFDIEDTDLSFKDGALEAVAEKAIERKTGARGLRSILENMLLDTMYEIPGREDITGVVVDADVVNGDKDPVLVMGDTKKTKKKKTEKKAKAEK